VRLKEKPSSDNSKEDLTALLEGEMRAAVEALNTDDKEAQYVILGIELLAACK
jgi:hypothetical protein